MIEVVREGPVARVWLSRPEVHNAMSVALLSELATAFHTLSHDDSVRVAVLGGRGASFCAGADIDAMKAAANATFEQNIADAEKLAGAFAAIADFPKPVVARIQGNVLGGGVGLVCAADIAVADGEAKFGLTEVRLGILPAVISPYVIRRLGDRRARELMLTGERFSAAHALHVGLLHHVALPADLDAVVDGRVAELLKAAPGAQKRVKMLLELWGEVSWEEYRSSLPRTLAEVRASDEAKDGLSSFFEKRKPKWLQK